MAGSDILTFIQPNGTHIPLVGQYGQLTLSVLRGKKGFGMPPNSFVNDKIYNLPGSIKRQVRVEDRLIDIPLLIEAPSDSIMRMGLRSLFKQLDPILGDGILQIQVADGTTRQITCSYSHGLEGDESSDHAGKTYRIEVASFECFDPYFYDTNDTEHDFNPAAPHAFFPFSFPFSVSPSSAGGVFTIINDGDAQAWPRWIISGPGDTLVLTNQTSGRSLALTYSIASGHAVYIDTTPTIKTCLLDNNPAQSLYSSLSQPPDLWPLEVGSNQVLVQLLHTSGNAGVTMLYRRRYITV